MDSFSLDPKLQKILAQLEPFGFTFYGFDEGGTPLVSGPNKQIIAINVAIAFVNNQIQTQRESSGSPESMPNMPTQNVERSSETSLETSVEKAAEEQPTQQKQPQPQQSPAPAQPAPKPGIVFQQPKIKPYGEGFDPKSFDPSDVSSTVTFIQKNAAKSKTSSNRWIAEQFKKFLEEVKAAKTS